MREILVFLAVCGVTYGGYSLYSLLWATKALEDEVDRELKDLDEKAAGEGLTASVFWAGRPLYWLVTLPLRSPLSALALAVLMVLPAFVLRS